MNILKLEIEIYIYIYNTTTTIEILISEAEGSFLWNVLMAQQWTNYLVIYGDIDWGHVVIFVFKKSKKRIMIL